jgi:hypothetical protein
MHPEEFLLRGTAWLSLLAWAAAVSLESGRSARRADAHAPARLASTLGLLALLLHVALAFDLRYAWSHALAARDTARQTEQLTGSRFGGGLFVNYAFVLVWAAEVAWWWRWPVSFAERPRAVTLVVRAIFVFMFVNGAIVFVRGPMRFVGIAAVLVVAWAWYREKRFDPPHD